MSVTRCDIKTEWDEKLEGDESLFAEKGKAASAFRRRSFLACLQPFCGCVGFSAPVASCRSHCVVQGQSVSVMVHVSGTASCIVRNIWGIRREEEGIIDANVSKQPRLKASSV